ncbi:MAG: histidine kinase dimerization/phospho-acceptor domain-containing protein, partial [Coriobacteriia bacterium]|nr:histidine kinase dimerization/phospho-acceptor domain-containing protein [Coriobacteriia bacterium]
MTEKERSKVGADFPVGATLASVPAEDVIASAASPQKKSLRHELRTPLNQIIGYSEMLQEDAEEQGLQTFAADLQKIERAGRRLLELVDEATDPASCRPALGSAPSIRDSQPSLDLSHDRASFLQAHESGPGTILVVDDNEANRD